MLRKVLFIGGPDDMQIRNISDDDLIFESHCASPTAAETPPTSAGLDPNKPALSRVYRRRSLIVGGHTRVVEVFICDGVAEDWATRITIIAMSLPGFAECFSRRDSYA